jgi:hypothetical protein
MEALQALAEAHRIRPDEHQMLHLLRWLLLLLLLQMAELVSRLEELLAQAGKTSQKLSRSAQSKDPS